MTDHLRARTRDVLRSHPLYRLQAWALTTSLAAALTVVAIIRNRRTR